MSKRLEFTKDLGNNKQLSIVTKKFKAGFIDTIASVGTVEGGFVSHLLFQDFYKTVISTPCDRITVKKLSEQHLKVISNLLSSILTEVGVHYAL
jgi:hypothetical protein